jgi:hypothetical protein
LTRVLNESTPLLEDEEVGGSTVVVILSRFSSVQRLMETHFNVEPVLRFHVGLFGKGPENNKLIADSWALGSPWETARVIEQTALKKMDVCLEGIKLTLYEVCRSRGHA